MTLQQGMFVLPLLLHVGLVILLYVVLTKVRVAAVKRGDTDIACFVLGREEPLEVARVTRNLANQFELPVICYFLAGLLLFFGTVTWWDIVAVWIFLVGRVVHMLVQTRTDNVALRGKVFVINFIGVCMLFGHVLWMVMTGLLA